MRGEVHLTVAAVRYQRRERLLSVSGHLDRVAVSLQLDPVHLRQRCVVLDQQDPDFVGLLHLQAAFWQAVRGECLVGQATSE